jgi:hypothetical protein
MRLKFAILGTIASSLLMPIAAQPPGTVTTTRIGQVSGRLDPDGLFHYQDTGQWGIEGVDLGASTVHQGKTFIFFGDVPRVGRSSGPIQDADAIGVIDDIRVPAPAQIAAGTQTANQSDAFFIGSNGALYVAGVVGGGHWFHPFQISVAGLAPAGGCVATARQLDHQLDVFFIGSNGGLYVQWVADNGTWQGPQQISPPEVAKPGGKLVTVKQLDNQLSVFFIGLDRRLQVAWVVGGGRWQGPLVVGKASLPYPEPGDAIAACKQGDKQLDVFFVGGDGGLYVAWSVAGDVWQGPQRISPAATRVSVAGASLAAFNQSPNEVTVLFVNNEGRLCSMFAIGGGVWHGPAPAVPRARLAKPGTSVSVTRQGPGHWDAFLVNRDGSLDVYWVGAGAWQGPFEFAPAGSSEEEGTLATVQQLDDQLTVIFGGRAGELNVSWVKGDGKWAGPVRINPEMTEVRYVTAGPFFRPFTIRGNETSPAQTWMLGTSETPTGAFSHGGKVYVFVVAGRERSVSYLTSSDWPDGPEPFKFEFAFSRGLAGGRFLQVAPVVVKTAELPDLKSPAAEGVILFGHGSASPGVPLRQGCVGPSSPAGVNLAFMPIVPGRGPSKEGTRYYGGDRSWVSDEQSGKTLFTTCYYWSSLSAGRIPGTGKWILLYQLSGPADVTNAHRLPVVARIADTPWDIATAPETPIFDPQREGAWGRYMFKPEEPDSDRNLPHIGHPAFAYGAFLLNKYTQWDGRLHVVTIYYLMSTGRPYQVQLMRSSIAL